MNREDFRPSNTKDPETIEPELRQALANFKSSVDAWSDAVMSRPREAKMQERRNWGLISNWALGCVVFAGTVTGAVYQNYRQAEAAKAEAAARAAEHERELAAQRVKEQTAEDLMAKVDSDISREVPSALEPLALMTEDENRKIERFADSRKFSEGRKR
jgi:hypothetical protein